jgi:hypothetical protein
MEIPFEAQEPGGIDRRCGVAALRMVLRSLGIEVSSEEIWNETARPARHGALAARTFLLAACALRRGLDAVCFESSAPWQSLGRAAAAGNRVIINQRVRPDSPLGHYTVLAAIEADAAIVHDPRLGPHRRLTRDELLALWRPLGEPSEIGGHVLVAVRAAGATSQACAVCRASWPTSIECPRCSRPIPLRPVDALGCPRADCLERLWKRLFCPWCDRGIREVRT